MTHEDYMQLAIDLAKKGCGWVDPNPMVGAIIVKENQIIGQGYHKKYGEDHAEIHALKNCSLDPNGAIMYVTLEPCCHIGKTPPCTQAIINSGIQRVLIGTSDPNPLVAGKGIDILRSHGISITENVAARKCRKLNERYFYFIKQKRPYVMMKYAMTMDGKIATQTGKSKWITGKKSRNNVQWDRHCYAAIMVGVNTIITDDPMLTCRLNNSKSPLRIICDTSLKTPHDAKVVTTTSIANTLIVTTIADKDKHAPYLNKNCDIMVVPKKNTYTNLDILFKKLGERQITSILLEGGGTLNWSMLSNNMVNKVQIYIAPKIFGGKGKSPIAGVGIDHPNQAFLLSKPSVQQIGEDLVLESEILSCLQE